MYLFNATVQSHLRNVNKQEQQQNYSKNNNLGGIETDINLKQKLFDKKVILTKIDKGNTSVMLYKKQNFNSRITGIAIFIYKKEKSYKWIGGRSYENYEFY